MDIFIDWEEAAAALDEAERIGPGHEKIAEIRAMLRAAAAAGGIGIGIGGGTGGGRRHGKLRRRRSPR